MVSITFLAITGAQEKRGQTYIHTYIQTSSHSDGAKNSTLTDSQSGECKYTAKLCGFGFDYKFLWLEQCQIVVNLCHAFFDSCILGAKVGQECKNTEDARMQHC